MQNKEKRGKKETKRIEEKGGSGKNIKGKGRSTGSYVIGRKRRKMRNGRKQQWR